MLLLCFLPIRREIESKRNGPHTAAVTSSHQFLQDNGRDYENSVGSFHSQPQPHGLPFKTSTALATEMAKLGKVPPDKPEDVSLIPRW